MEKQIKIAKLEAAKRQLETAIILYFNDKDPISIHTLVCASHEIIANLNKKTNGTPLILEGTIVKEEYKKDFRDMVREAKNFFKHANKDSDEVLDFNPDTNDHYLLDACEGYQLLTGEKNPYFITYRGWFNYKYPQILNNFVSYNIIKNRFRGDKLEFFKIMLAASVELQ